MSANKSVIENITLESDTEFYVQFSGVTPKATVSFDGPVASFSISISDEDLTKIVEAIKRAQEQNNDGK